MKRLPEKLRETFARPFGQILTEQQVLSKLAGMTGALVVSVGDTCSFALLKNNVNPDIIIYDLKNARVPVSAEVKSTLERYCPHAIRVQSPAGVITGELEKAVKSVLRAKKGSVFVEGEEDLASLIVMLHAQRGAVLLYGQPGEGIVFVEITLETKKTAQSLFKQFE
ncbi:GTP-dependent dephospho-CoA kinase family protein [Candidatus Micrarchaeota archaeon]|nr:GTP-dependent dephospho-CoA kinase family protein [Candidatus Micrarchaeota archaeon]